MRDGGVVLALDLATAYGFAVGPLGGVPRAFSGRFAERGSSHARVAGAAISWFHRLLKDIQPNAVFIERPHLGSIRRGTTSFDVIYRLLGLPFACAGIAERHGILDVRLVRVEDIRKHFIGAPNLKGEDAKRRVQDRCRDLDWPFANGDEADSLALWSYACEMLQPGSGYSSQLSFPGLDHRIPPRRTLRLKAAEARDLFSKRGGRRG